MQSKSLSFQSNYDKALQNSTSNIGKYLQSLNGTKASLLGYIKYLITTKASTVALTVATDVMKTALITGLTVGISFITQQISKWIHTQEEARQKAIELTNSYKEQKDFLNSQIEKYKELKRTLDNGNLSTDETRSIKEQLLETQKSLIESYGNEASNIDLVNGKYKEQLELLKEISIKEADKYVKENRSTFENAKKELNKVRTYKIGSIFSYESRAGVGMSNAQKQLYDYIESYSELFNIKIKYDTSTLKKNDYVATLYVNANANDAKLTIDKFYDDIEKYIKENNLQLDYNSLQIDLSKVSSNIETDNALKEYREIYNEFMKAEVVRNDTLRPLYQQSIQAVEDYNDALSSGEGIAEATANLDAVQRSVQNAAKELEGSQEVFDGIYNGINTNAEAAYQMSQAFENDESVKKYAEQLNGLTDIDLKSINFEDNVESPGEKAFGALIDILGLSQEEVQKLIDKLVELGYVQGKEQPAITPSEPTLLSEGNIKIIDNYKKNLQELHAALNLLRTGEVSSLDINELIAKFPELAMYVDNLEEGIESLIEEELGGLKKAFDGVIGEEFLRKITESSVKQNSITNSFKTTTSSLNEMTSAYKNVADAMKQYNETGHISLELLETLMEMKPEYLGALMDEWGNIDNATDAYKAYMKVRAKDYLNSAHEELVLNQRKLYAEHQKRTEGLEFPKESDDSKEAEIYRASLKQYKEEVKVYENSWASKNKFYTMILNDEWDGIFSSSSTSDFEQNIDWASHYISALQNKVSSLQDTLSNTSGYDNQINEIDKLIIAQKNLSGGYEKTRDTYQAKYENILNNGILAEQGLTEAVRNKIEKDENFSSEDFSIEDFIANNIESGDISLEQQIYEALQEAIDWYNKKSEADKNILKIKSEIDESKLSKYDVLRKKSEAHINTLKNSQKNITDTIDFNGNKATEEQYNNLILYQMGIRKVLEDKYKYESSLLTTLNSETDQYTEQEKLVRECADGLVKCDKSIKDWQLDILRLELEAIDDGIDSINDKIKANQDEIDEKDKLISGAVGILNQEVKVQEGLRDVIQDRIDALQEENDEHERALALEKAKYELQRAYSQRTVKLYSGEERGFIYTQDREAVRDAQENLDKLEYEETIHALQEQVGYYDDIIGVCEEKSVNSDLL